MNQHLQQHPKRDPSVYIGLKNAGATCYMNSVFQQLFMIEPVQEAICKASYWLDDSKMNEKELRELSYARRLICSVQQIFAHLRYSDENFYTPEMFWHTFQIAGHDVDVREQQDAVEFYHALIDALDESFKKLGKEPIFENLFGGKLADQMKCKDCPHKYEKEELFTLLSVDVKAHNNLIDSLGEYVTGEVLEGDNAYFCEKCNAKVTAVKRMCIAKLPPYLMIQLKRFDMDRFNGSAIKISDYFEFPTELDMGPFTKQAVEKSENGVPSGASNQTCEGSSKSTKYRLRGVIVHSGEAHGGHYYSYIAENKKELQWYKFDDTFVTPWKYDETASKNEWFGGYHNIDTPSSSFKVGRPFSAYMLVYEMIEPAVSGIESSPYLAIANNVYKKEACFSTVNDRTFSSNCENEAEQRRCYGEIPSAPGIESHPYLVLAKNNIKKETFVSNADDQSLKREDSLYNFDLDQYKDPNYWKKDMKLKEKQMNSYGYHELEQNLRQSPQVPFPYSPGLAWDDRRSATPLSMYSQSMPPKTSQGGTILYQQHMPSSQPEHLMYPPQPLLSSQMYPQSLASYMFDHLPVNGYPTEQQMFNNLSQNAYRGSRH